jgi:hypothetical protein
MTFQCFDFMTTSRHGNSPQIREPRKNGDRQALQLAWDGGREANPLRMSPLITDRKIAPEEGNTGLDDDDR